MPRFLLVIAVLAGWQVVPADAQPRFEVASVRPAPAEVPMGIEKGGPGTDQPTRITFTRATLLQIIMSAHGVMFDFEYSVPSWMMNARFDVAATMPAGTTKAEFRLMLQDLLRERFGMKTHIDRKEITGWRLTVAKGGPKLNEGVVDPNAGPADLELDKDKMMQVPPSRKKILAFALRDRRMRISSRLQTMPDIAEHFRVFLHGPVVDETGLTGSYDFNLDFASEYMQPPAGQILVDQNGDPAPDLVTAVSQQLGLKLTPAKMPFDVLVVDSALRTPTEN